MQETKRNLPYYVPVRLGQSQHQKLKALAILRGNNVSAQIRELIDAVAVTVTMDNNGQTPRQEQYREQVAA